jgi:hypothetical protein
MLDLAAPVKLRVSLIGVPRDSLFAVSYIPKNESKSVNITLTPTEYGLIIRDIPSLAKTAISNTLISRPARRDFTRDVDAARRAKVHALTGKKASMDTYLRGPLQNEEGLLRKFTEAAKCPDLWIMLEGEMREELGWILESVFGCMLTAIRYQRDWTPVEEDTAKRAIMKRLFFERQRGRHIQNWQGMLGLSLEYLSHRQALFGDRIAKASEEIDKQSNGKERSN